MLYFLASNATLVGITFLFLSNKLLGWLINATISKSLLFINNSNTLAENFAVPAKTNFIFWFFITIIIVIFNYKYNKFN